METTFMTIHNLSPEANILFASESIVDILGFSPEEVMGRSCFDYFHPDEVPFARRIHNRGVQMDKAAVLHYARIMNRDGFWVGCECVFTVVFEVLVACTSIYRGDAKNDRRAVEAPAIRRLFASSPRDPRYHMLEHLSSKFRSPPQPSLLEPRAALILNRFTRTLTVMYATNAVSSILGITPHQFKDKSFYECMQENCLPEAIRCLESAKANDSIAYLRFWYRDPRRPEDFDEEIRESSHSSDSEDGGVELDGHMAIDEDSTLDGNSTRSYTTQDDPTQVQSGHNDLRQLALRTYSDENSDVKNRARASFDPSQRSRSPITSVSLISQEEQRPHSGTPHQPSMEPFELEAVVSCTSDGLVVVLRRARPLIPSLQQPPPPIQPLQSADGLFAAPWGANPIRPHLYRPNQQFPFHHSLEAPQYPVGGPPADEFMNSIREVAVFAWSLTGINGNIAAYGYGIPRGEAIPPNGLPIWDPFSQPSPGYFPPINQAAQRWAQMGEKTSIPGDVNSIPYQQNRQDGFGRDVNTYGSGITYSRSPLSRNDVPMANQISNIYLQNSLLIDPTQSQAHNIPIATVEVGNNKEQTPSQDFHGPREGTHGNMYLWY